MHRANILSQILFQNKYRSSNQYTGRWKIVMYRNEKLMRSIHELIEDEQNLEKGEIELNCEIVFVSTQDNKMYFLCEDISIPNVTTKPFGYLIIEFGWVKSMERISIDECEVEVDL